MSGEFDIVLRLEASAADRIRAIWQEIASMPGVRDTLTSFALSPYRRG
jgi:DNA-binding Lrp family transcriptional regulator